MKKTTGIKAKKLMVDDHLKIGGVLFHHCCLSVRPGTLFTIYNQK